MLIDLIRADALSARKNRETAKASSLTTLIGEAERIGKDNGNRPPTDDEVQALLKKFIKGITETQAVAREAQRDALAAERALYESYLPAQVSGAELEALVRELVAALPERSPAAMGVVMRQLRERLNGAFDGGEANKLIRAALA